MDQVLVPFDTMQSEFKRILADNGLSEKDAAVCARIFAENSLDGVNSHGINRFPRFINYIEKGFVKPGAKPALVHSAGALEQWDGQLGPGPLNALFCANRSMELASDYGMGCVAIGNTNHWMRGGTYGWHTAKNGYAFIGWTNTEANMPAWGARESRLGNNPLVIAMPFENEAIVLDFAMTQFSYGKMEAYSMDGSPLPYPGGFNKDGKLSVLPEEILHSRRALPVGYWKGAGLSLLLDILAAILSAGLSTNQLSRLESEYSVSQVFIVFNLKALKNFSTIEKSLNQIIQDFKNSMPDETNAEIRYPGERVLFTRERNLKNGVPVNSSVWEKIKRM